MKDIFRPVTRSIVDLIRKQIASIPIRGNFKGAPAKVRIDALHRRQRANGA